MKTTDHLYSSIASIVTKVKQDFKSKGVIIPSYNAAGNVTIGDFSILKRNTGYFIVSSKSRNTPIVGPINLPETAIIIANDCAVGKMIDNTLVHNDTWWGFKNFDELHATTLASRQVKSDSDMAELSRHKASIAHAQKLIYKAKITAKLSKLYLL